MCPRKRCCHCARPCQWQSATESPATATGHRATLPCWTEPQSAGWRSARITLCHLKGNTHHISNWRTATITVSSEDKHRSQQQLQGIRCRASLKVSKTYSLDCNDTLQMLITCIHLHRMLQCITILATLHPTTKYLFVVQDRSVSTISAGHLGPLFFLYILGS